MNQYIEEQINNVGGEIDTIYTLIRALMTCILGTEELTPKDAGNILYLLESKINSLKRKQDKIIEELDI